MVKSVISEALANSSRALKTPAPDVVLAAFDSSAITYRVRFWIDDYEHDEAARHEGRTNIFHAFARHNIEIPWPIQVEYSREWVEPDSRGRTAERIALLAGVDLFAGLEDEMLAEM